MDHRMSKAGFIFSAIGAAVGLGNIWRFPENMITNGGFAFLLPYIFAIFVLGLPLLIVEINLGSMWRKTPVGIYSRYLGRHGKFFGWFQTATQLLIGTYYAVIISWIIISGIEIFNYDEKIGNFFEEKIISKNIINWKIALICCVVLFFCWIVIRFAFGKGIEIVNKIMMPGLFLLIFGILFYSIFLKGAQKGLEHIFEPKWAKLKSLDTWGKAFSQAFFSLSLVVATMIVYASKGPKNGDNTNRALIIMAGDTLIALFSCIIVASIIGYSAENNGEEIGQFVKKIKNGNSTSGVVFGIFPKIFHEINSKTSSLGSIIGLSFYIALFFAAFSSLIGLVEPTASALNEEYKWKRSNAAFFSVLIQLIFGIVFWFPAFVKSIDIVNNIYVGNILIISSLVQFAMLIRKYKFIEQIINFNNKTSYFKLKKWFYYFLIFGFISLIISVIFTLINPLITVQEQRNLNNQPKNLDWVLSTLTFFIPFLFLTLGFGYLDTWKKLVIKFKKNQIILIIKEIFGSYFFGLFLPISFLVLFLIKNEKIKVKCLKFIKKWKEK